MRSALLTLPPGGTAAFTPLFRFDASVDGGVRGSSWRVLQIGSLTGGPFDVRLDWTADGGDSAAALLTAAAGTQVSLFARTATVAVRNLDTANDNRIMGVLGDGYAVTRNVFQVWAPTPPTALILELPAWARSLEVQAANTGATGQVRFLTATGAVLSVVALGSIPPGGALIGGAATAELTCTHACRVLYHLSI